MIWQEIHDELGGAGLNPYPPGKHKGECLERYCVLRQGSQSPFIGTNKVGYEMIDIILFIPEFNEYTEMEKYKKEVKTALKRLSFLRLTGNETPTIPDSKKKAYTCSIEYQVLKRL